MSSSTDAASMPATRWDCGKWGHDSQLHPGLLGVRRFCPGVCVHSHDSNVLMCGRVSCFVQLSFCFSGAFLKHIQLKRWHAALQLLLAAALAVLEQPRHRSSTLLVTPPTFEVSPCRALVGVWCVFKAFLVIMNQLFTNNVFNSFFLMTKRGVEGFRAGRTIGSSARTQRKRAASQRSFLYFSVAPRAMVATAFHHTSWSVRSNDDS